MLCHFCSEPAHGSCVWPVERFDEAEVGQLKEGDVIRRFDESKRTDWSVATVERLERLVGGVIRVSLSIRTKAWSVRGKTFEANDFSRCRVKVKVPCGVPVCECHIQIRGPGHYICKDHWFAFESKVA